MVQRAESILAPSLPQKDNAVVQKEREIQLYFTRDVYEYSTATGLPMPMAAMHIRTITITSRIRKV